MDWTFMLADGTIDIGAATGRGDPVFVGEGPLQNIQVEVYIPGTVVATTTLLIEQSANDASYHTLYTFTVPAQTVAHTYFLTLTPWDHKYLNYNFSAIAGGSDLGYVQIGLIIGEKPRTS